MTTDKSCVRILGLIVCDRPNDWRCSSSIPATDWDTHRVPFTTKTSHGKKDRGDPAGRERCVTFSSRVARGIIDTETCPQKDNG